MNSDDIEDLLCRAPDIKDFLSGITSPPEVQYRCQQLRSSLDTQFLELSRRRLALARTENSLADPQTVITAQDKLSSCLNEFHELLQRADAEQQALCLDGDKEALSRRGKLLSRHTSCKHPPPLALITAYLSALAMHLPVVPADDVALSAALDDHMISLTTYLSTRESSVMPLPTTSAASPPASARGVGGSGSSLGGHNRGSGGSGSGGGVIGGSGSGGSVIGGSAPSGSSGNGGGSGIGASEEAGGGGRGSAAPIPSTPPPPMIKSVQEVVHALSNTIRLHRLRLHPDSSVGSSSTSTTAQDVERFAITCPSLSAEAGLGARGSNGVIARGGTSSVWTGTLRGQRVALKRFDGGGVSARVNKLRNTFLAEACILAEAGARCPEGVVPLLGYVAEASPGENVGDPSSSPLHLCALVMPRLRDLASVIEDPPMPMSHRLSILLDVAHTLDVLHNSVCMGDGGASAVSGVGGVRDAVESRPHYLLHCDIKPANILLDFRVRLHDDDSDKVTAGEDGGASLSSITPQLAEEEGVRLSRAPAPPPRALLADFGISHFMSVDAALHHQSENKSLLTDGSGGRNGRTEGYADTGVLEGRFPSKASDVFSFGRLSQVVLTWSSSNSSREGGTVDASTSAAEVAKERWSQHHWADMGMNRCAGGPGGVRMAPAPTEYPVDSAVIELVDNCLHDRRAARPTMARVVAQLKEALALALKASVVSTLVGRGQY